MVDNEYGDGLKVQKFKLEPSVIFTGVNPETPKKITKNNKKGKGWVLIPIAISSVIVGGVINSAIESQTHDQVLHDLDGDYVSEGILHHSHELNEEYFIKDYKFVNPLATKEDVYEAFKNGEYVEYQSGGKGNINIESKLQIDEEVKAAEYYNNECKDFLEQFQEKEEVMKNQR